MTTLGPGAADRSGAVTAPSRSRLKGSRLKDTGRGLAQSTGLILLFESREVRQGSTIQALARLNNTGPMVFWQHGWEPYVEHRDTWACVVLFWLQQSQSPPLPSKPTFSLFLKSILSNYLSN